jgi:hypothetical protein
LINIKYRRLLLLACFSLCGISLLAGAVDGFRLDNVMQAVQKLYGGNAAAAARDWNDALTFFRGESEQKKL